MDITIEEIQEIVDNSINKDIILPNIYNTPYIIVPTMLGTQQFLFEYKWNNRHEKVYLSIYKIEDSEYVYYLKNLCLIPNINISKKITNTDWGFYLVFMNRDGNFDSSYTIKDFSEKFKLFYAYRTD